MQRGRKASAKEGKSISKKPPYGYKKDENLKLYPDPETSWVVQKIFTMISGTFGRTQIARELDYLDIKPPQGEYWSPSTISSIISFNCSDTTLSVSGKVPIAKSPADKVAESNHCLFWVA